MMKSDSLFKKRFRIPSTRLLSWDYSSSGYYFVTICTHQKKEYFGKINNRKMELSAMGKIAQTYWKEIPKHFPFVILDESVIMPNHVHGIVIITNQKHTTNDRILHLCRDGACPVSTHKTNVLGNIIGSFKSVVTKCANKNRIPFHWQSRYYDHIIRSENELHSIREYIHYNPLKWEEDEENPMNTIN